MANKRFRLDREGFKKICKGALIAAVGAGTAYAASQGMPEFNKTEWVAFGSGLLAVVTNALWKFVVGTSQVVVAEAVEDMAEKSEEDEKEE